MRRLFLLLNAISVAICFWGCAKLVNPGPELAVNVVGAFSTIQANSAPVNLHATVVNDFRNGVRWSLSQAGLPCSPGCGTLVPASNSIADLEAVYAPPQTPPLNQSATIMVSSITDDTKRFIFNFTITPGVTVSVAPKFTNAIVGGPKVSVTATVMNDPANAGVTWTLTAGGTDCTPACGTLVLPPTPVFTVTYVPPTTLPTGAAATPTLTAASVTNPKVTDGFSFTFSPPTALLKGSYAFLLRGYDVASSPMAMAGSVTADGNGNITAGEFDVDNDGGITHAPSPLTGTYTIDPTGGILRGAITITSFHFTQGGSNVVFKFVLSADATNGSIVELDGVGYRNSGTIHLQDASALSAAKVSGTFAFGLDSDAPVGGRIVEAGQLVIASGGAVTGIVDQSKAGDPAPRYSATPIDSGTLTAADSSGRGTLSLTIQGTTSTYAYYIVNSNQLYLVQTDPGRTFGTAQSGVAQLQKPLAAGSVFGTSIIQMTGMDVSPTPPNAIGPDVIVGVMNVAPGNQNGSFFNLTFDSNDIGIILPAHPTGGFVTTFDPTTGRGVINVPGGFQTGFVNTATFYLYDAGSGFIIDSDLSTPAGTPVNLTSTNNAFSGTFTPQAQPPFDNTSLSGSLILRSGGSAIPQIPNITAGVTVDNTQRLLSAVGDLTSLDSQAGNVPNVSFGGPYSIVNAPSQSGRGVAQFPAGFFGDFASSQPVNAVFYLIAPNQFVLIGAQSGIESGVTFFTPQ